MYTRLKKKKKNVQVGVGLGDTTSKNEIDRIFDICEHIEERFIKSAMSFALN